MDHVDELFNKLKDMPLNELLILCSQAIEMNMEKEKADILFGILEFKLMKKKVEFSMKQKALNFYEAWVANREKSVEIHFGTNSTEEFQIGAMRLHMFGRRYYEADWFIVEESEKSVTVTRSQLEKTLRNQASSIYLTRADFESLCMELGL